jgi:hypothetical protein
MKNKFVVALILFGFLLIPNSNEPYDYLGVLGYTAGTVEGTKFTFRYCPGFLRFTSLGLLLGPIRQTWAGTQENWRGLGCFPFIDPSPNCVTTLWHPFHADDSNSDNILWHFADTTQAS